MEGEKKNQKTLRILNLWSECAVMADTCLTLQKAKVIIKAALRILSLIQYLKLKLQGTDKCKKTSRVQHKAYDCNAEFEILQRKIAQIILKWICKTTEQSG